MVYVEIVNELSGLKQYLYVIEPRVIFDQILKTYPQYRDDFAQTYVELLSQEKDKTKPSIKFVEGLLLEITKHIDWFNKYIVKLGDLVEQRYYDQPQIIRILMVNGQIQKTIKIEKIN